MSLTSPWLPIQFANPEGQTLAGLLLQGASFPGPLLTVCHGFTGSKEGQGKTLDMGRTLSDQLGISVLVFDFAGNGQSQGRFEDLTLSRQIGDLTAALDWGQASGFGPLLTMGRSFGGTTALCQAASDTRVAGVCTWAAAADLKALFQGFADPKTLDQDLVRLEGEQGELMISQAFFQDLGTHDLCSATAGISPRPLLLIHGAEDRVVPVSEAHVLFACAGQPKQLEILPGADHQFACAVHEVWELTRAWLQKALEQA
jgi:putative redox protein